MIVIHGAWSFSSVVGLRAAIRAAKPCVLVPHESLTEYDVNRQGSAARIVAKRNLKRFYGRNCSLFVFTSRAEAVQSFPDGSKARQVVLPYPLFDDRAAVALNARGFTNADFRIGFLGRLHPKKNVDVLLRVLSLLPEQFTLTIGGDGPPEMRAQLVSLANQLGISRRVEWKGFISAEAKDDFFRKIDVLVMPSAFESFGIVAAEAMMRGVPSIVSPRTGAAEVIGENGGGVVVEPVDALLAQAISSLDADRQRMATLSEEAVGVVRQKLSFSYIGSRLRDQCHEIAAGGRPAQARTRAATRGR